MHINRRKKEREERGRELERKEGKEGEREGGRDGEVRSEKEVKGGEA